MCTRYIVILPVFMCDAWQDPELNCFNTNINNNVMLSEELEFCRKLKKGGNGAVYRCKLRNYRGSKQLVCKIEHKVVI